ncbi:hypothetical protein N0472_34855, partial [Pseudomonas aeruginosa]|nr:hypothetical protein [Pseudomonas aeruginosa]
CSPLNMDRVVSTVIRILNQTGNSARRSNIDALSILKGYRSSERDTIEGVIETSECCCFS